MRFDVGAVERIVNVPVACSLGDQMKQTNLILRAVSRAAIDEGLVYYRLEMATSSQRGYVQVRLWFRRELAPTWWRRLWGCWWRARRPRIA